MSNPLFGSLALSVVAPATLLAMAATATVASAVPVATPEIVAQSAPATTPVPATTTVPTQLPINTVLELEMLDAVSSELNHPGDFFRMRVAVAIVDHGQVLVPVDTIAIGQVVHAARSRGGGKAGELILAARYLELPQGQVRLRSTFGAAGANRVKASLALAYVVGPFAMMVKGHAMQMPVGAPLSARIAEDTLIVPAKLPASP